MKYSTDTSFLSADKIKAMQQERFLETLAYVATHSPFYKEQFKSKNIDPSKIKSLADISTLPQTTKSDMQHWNWDFLCVPRNEIVEYTSTSGTLGSPVTIALTANDLDRLASNEYGSFVCADGTKEDIYQLLLTLDRQFMAGIAYYSGLRKLGAGIIRLGPGSPAMQWENIRRLSPTIIVGVPSMLLRLVEFAKELDIDLNTSTVKKAICIGENIRNPDFSLNILGQKISSAWKIQLYSTYASTEMQTAFTECKSGIGGHQQPDLIYVELLDENGKQVPEGEAGEVTITTFGVEGMPLLRYRTGDMCISHSDVCACGRHSMRLSPVLGRKQQMIKLKGTTMYPPALFELLNGIEEIKDYVAEVYSNEIGTDEVVLHIQPQHMGLELTQKIRADLQARLRVVPQIKYVSPEDIQRLQFTDGSRKAQKFRDHWLIV